MTTKVHILNDPSSNGDVILNGVNVSSGSAHGRVKDHAIRPGESGEFWITTSTALFLTETWPTQSKNESDAAVLACGDNGEAWAKAFVRQFPNADEDTMRAWFQNAIESADTARRESRAERIVDDVDPASRD